MAEEEEDRRRFIVSVGFENIKLFVWNAYLFRGNFDLHTVCNGLVRGRSLCINNKAVIVKVSDMYTRIAYSKWLQK